MSCRRVGRERQAGLPVCESLVDGTRYRNQGRSTHQLLANSELRGAKNNDFRKNGSSKSGSAH